MKLSLVVVAGIVVVLQFVKETKAECCRANNFGKCRDGRLGTPFCCAHRTCNIFCCNCNGGCRTPRLSRFTGEHPMRDILRERRDGTHVVALGDRDGDGKMSLEEGLAHLDHLEDKEVVKRNLREMDLDGDGFLSPMEVDPSL